MRGGGGAGAAYRQGPDRDQVGVALEGDLEGAGALVDLVGLRALHLLGGLGDSGLEPRQELAGLGDKVGRERRVERRQVRQVDVEHHLARVDILPELVADHVEREHDVRGAES